LLRDFRRPFSRRGYRRLRSLEPRLSLAHVPWRSKELCHCQLLQDPPPSLDGRKALLPTITILPLIAAISWHADLSSNWFPARRWLSPNCVPISLEYGQHRAKQHDVVAMAIERRRVQSRGAASVKKQGIGAIQRVTE
jgi:hypothetical protein